MANKKVGMEIKAALKAISTGHAIYSVEYAREVCKAFRVDFSPRLVRVFESDRHPLGVTMYRGPEDGVWSLTLAGHVAKCLGVENEAQDFFGRGSQAREYARVVAKKLGLPVEA